MAIVARLLREMRAAQGLTQAQVAERLVKPQSYVSKYETGERRLDVLELRKLCHIYGISLSTFARRLERELSDR